VVREAALKADQSFDNGNYETTPVNGLRAFARVYCGWAYSQTFFREHLYRQLGFSSIETLMQDWEQDHLRWDANNLLSKLLTWKTADIGRHLKFGNSFKNAMRSITARTIVMPCRTDLYFPPEDSETEVSFMQNASLRVIDSDWGHCSASPGRNAEVMALLESVFAELLDHQGATN